MMLTLKEEWKVSFEDISVKEFMDRLASDEPAPGGGSASAIAGAMGSCLMGMVSNLTIGREKFREYEEHMKTALDNSTRLREELIQAADRDAEAFNRVIAAMKLPKGTEEEKRIRTQMLQEALKGAALKPFDVALLCIEVLKLAWDLHDKGNPNALSDVGVGAHLAYAGMQGAIMNVEINLPMIKDPEFVDELKEKVEKAKTEGNRVYRHIIANVKF